MKNKKYGFIKKRIAMAIAVVTAITLTACGSKETTASQTDELNEYVYVPEFHILDIEEEGNINNLKIYGDNLYYNFFSYDENAQEMINEFVRCPLEDLGNSEILNLNKDVPEGSTAGMGEFTFDNEGNLYSIRQISPRYVEGMEYQESDYKTFLVKYDADFQEVWSVDLAEVVSKENLYIQNMAVG